MQTNQTTEKKFQVFISRNGVESREFPDSELAQADTMEEAEDMANDLDMIHGEEGIEFNAREVATKTPTAGEWTHLISFKGSKVEWNLIAKIANRAVALSKKCGGDYSVMTANMDISACHANGCPLKLVELLEADEFTFAHDVFGIREHINRTTGQLEDCFLPRTAQ